jgi:hypothetical protein
MGPVTRMVLVGGLAALRALFLLTAALMLVLTVVQFVRADEAASLLRNGATTLALGAAGWIAGRAGRWVAALPG